MDQGLPSDILMGKRRPLFGGWKPSRDQVFGGIVALVFVAGMSLGLVALNSFVLAPTGEPTGTATATDLGVYTPSATGSIVHVTTVAPPASGRDELTVTYTPPAPPAHTGGSYAYGSYPAGYRVPNIPGTDAPDTSACASSSASTVGGVSVCD